MPTPHHRIILETPATPPALAPITSPLDLIALYPLAMWLNGSVGLFQDTAKTTPATIANDPVGAWADQSGGVIDVLQGTAGNRPTLQLAVQNGRNALLFDGTNDVLQSAAFTALAQPNTIFAICARVNATSAIKAVVDGTGTNRNQLAYSTTNRLQFYAGTTMNANILNADYTAWSVLSACFDNTTAFGGRNGAVVVNGTSGTQTPTRFTIGADSTLTGSLLDGYVGEVIAYNARLSPTDHYRVAQWLGARWGILV